MPLNGDLWPNACQTAGTRNENGSESLLQIFSFWHIFSNGGQQANNCQFGGSRNEKILEPLDYTIL